MSQHIHESPGLVSIAKELDPYLEANTVYYFVNTHTKHGVSFRDMFEIKNGIKKYDDRSEIEVVEQLNGITKTLPQNTVVKYTIRKESPITAVILTPEMLLEEIHLQIKTQMDAGFTKVALVGEFTNGQLVAINETWVTVDGKVNKQEWSYVPDELNAFVMSTNPEITAMSIQIEGDVLTAQSSPAVPGLTTEYVPEPENLDLDNNDLAAIYNFLESFSDTKRALAMKALNDNPEFYQKAEQRYLNFIRTRLNDPNAGVERFEDAALTKTEVKLFLGRHFQNNMISFSYFNDHEAKLVIDFIGSMVKNTINIEEYIAKARTVDSEEALIKLYDTSAKDVKKKIVKEAAVGTEGWFGEIMRHLINLKLKKVMLNKTEMEIADGSPVMKEFMFFLNINSKKSILIDIFQSEAPRFTEMFWMLREVPDTSWGDVSKKIPDSPLAFSRTARYDLGDGYGWELIVKP